MSTPKYVVRPELKREILEKVKSGEDVKALAASYGVSHQAIYAWLQKGVTAPPSLLELVKLKKENQELRELVGTVYRELTQEKKKSARA